MSLTRDAKKLLYLMYEEYLNRRKHGTPRDDAKFFGGDNKIQSEIMPDELIEDVRSYLKELSRSGYVDISHANNLVYLCYLSDNAIATLEDLPLDVLSSLAEFLLRFLP